MSVAPGHAVGSSSREALGPARIVSLTLFASLPLVALAMAFLTAHVDGSTALDFGQFYDAAEAVLQGESPYDAAAGPPSPWGGPYPYPPLPALLAIPFTLVSLEAARVAVMAALVLVALAIPLVLGVRDWRCFGLALLWPPVISAIQTGNLTLPLALAAAVAWRCRERAVVSSGLVAVTLAAKLFLWPLVVWFAATRRFLTSLLTVLVAIGLLALSWAVIGFAGLADYPDLMRRLQDSVGMDSYTLYVVGLDLGLPSPLARMLWLGAGAAILGALVVVARRGDERSAFILAIAASLALTPIVWLHYFALLLLVVSLAQPRLGLLWFLPLGMVVTPGSGHPTPFETAATLAIAAVMMFLALRGTGMRVASRPVQAVADDGGGVR
jgi:hypothetical protein